MTQSDRILRALKRGSVSPIDFTDPTCDGAGPIMRVAARVQELRDQGHTILTSRAGNGTAIYRLAPGVDHVSEATAAETPEGSCSTAAGVIGRPADPPTGPSGPAEPVPLPPSLAETEPGLSGGSLFNHDEFAERASHWKVG